MIKQIQVRQIRILKTQSDFKLLTSQKKYWKLILIMVRSKLCLIIFGITTDESSKSEVNSQTGIHQGNNCTRTENFRKFRKFTFFPKMLSILYSLSKIFPYFLCVHNYLIDPLFNHRSIIPNQNFFPTFYGFDLSKFSKGQGIWGKK